MLLKLCCLSWWFKIFFFYFSFRLSQKHSHTMWNSVLGLYCICQIVDGGRYIDVKLLVPVSQMFYMDECLFSK